MNGRLISPSLEVTEGAAPAVGLDNAGRCGHRRTYAEDRTKGSPPAKRGWEFGLKLGGGGEG